MLMVMALRRRYLAYLGGGLDADAAFRKKTELYYCMYTVVGYCFNNWRDLLCLFNLKKYINMNPDRLRTQ